MAPGDRLSRRGIVADIFIVGGAAMAMAYDATRVTCDVDARFVPHGIVPMRPAASPTISGCLTGG